MNEEEAAGAFQSLLSAESGTQEPEAVESQEEAEPVDVAEDDAAADAEDEAEPEAEDEEEEKPTFTVKIDGKEVKVPLDELTAGYQRNADYTRKTQELATQRKAAESELATAKAERAHYAQGLQQLENAIKQTAPTQPDWNDLAANNPAEYVRLQHVFQQRQAALNHIEAERQRTAQADQVEQDKVAQELVERGREELAKAIPEWKDAKKASTDKADMVKYGISHGYTADELSGITDHRAILILRKAMLHDRAQAQGKTLRPVVQAGPKPAQPGSGNTRQSSETRAMRRLQQTGSIEDAAAVLMRTM